MKKITGFFLAFMPIFVVILLFISGMIVKSAMHVYVRQVEISENELEIQKTEDSSQETYQLSANILPLNASNPNVEWSSSDESIATVDSKGLVTTVGWGDCYIYVASKENPMLMDRCKLEVWDNKIHKISIDNEFNAQYLPFYQSVKLQAKPVPSKRLTVDPTLTYSSDKSDVVVGDDGTIRSTSGNNVDATITVKTTEQEGQPEVKREFKVQVRPGVVQVEPKDASNTVTSKAKINFADEIVSYPDTNVDATEFAYTSSDPNVAIVSNEKETAGQVTFIQKDKDVKITATYKRNEALLVEKTIQSSCQYLNDVYFNRYTYESDLDDTPVGSNLPITYSSYPIDEENANIYFSTTNQSVVWPHLNEQTNKWEFTVEGQGYALLKVWVTLDQEGHTAEDYCLVTITNKKSTASIFKSESVSTDSYYYSLRDNINQDVLFPRQQNIEWTIEDEDEICTFDDTNWIIHFKPTVESGSVKVTGKVGDNPYSFTLACNPKAATSLPTEQTEFKVKVGQKYNFDSCYLTDLSTDSFDVETSGILGKRIVSFIPKNGGVYSATLHGTSLFGKAITLKVEEKPVDIKYADNIEPYISTVNEKFDVKKALVPTIIPSSATDAEGAIISPKLDYVTEQQIVRVEDDVLTFLQSTTALVYVSAGDLEPDVFGIHSTMGKVGKFTLKDSDEKEIASYDQINFNVGDSKSIYLKQIFSGETIAEAITKKFKVTSLTGNQVLQFQEEAIWEQAKGVRFDFKALKSGTETLCISSETYCFYLKVNVAIETTDLKLYYRMTELDNKNEATTLSPNIELLVTGTPITAEAKNLAASIKDQEGVETALTITDGKIKLTDAIIASKGAYTLNIKATSVSGTQLSKDWTINYTDDITTLDVGLAEAEDFGKSETCNGTVFLAADQTQLTTTLSIKTNKGVVIGADDFFKFFTLNLDGESIKPTFNKFTTTATSPKQSLEYEKDVTLNFDNGTTQLKLKTYRLSREIVARIVLPNHDNTDKTDKKGLQKVHVYANQSYYNAEEKLVNYYKLPIDLYNVNHEKLEGDAKAKAFDRLVKKVYIGNTLQADASKHLTYNSQGFVEVKFNDSKLYDFYEIYDNKFDSNGDSKNFTVDFSTHSQMADAHYTFVPVKGINTYCQEAFEYSGLRGDGMFVLQVDFEKQGVPHSVTNMPFTRHDIRQHGFLIGNGHTFNFTQLSKDPSITNVHFYGVINASMQGIDSDKLLPEKKFDYKFNLELRDYETPLKTPFVAAYCDISYFCEGIFISKEPEIITNVKNCMFHDNVMYGFAVQSSSDKISKCYLEDNVFFNAGSFGIACITQSQLYFKGFNDVYNFHTGKQIFDNIQGFKVPWVWDRLCRPAAVKENMIQYNCEGQEVINSVAGSILGGYYYFFTGYDAEGKPVYEALQHGVPTAAQHFYNFVNLSVPFLGEVGMWGTINYEHEAGAPQYSDEFNSQGELQLDFFQHQMQKITRIPKYF